MQPTVISFFNASFVVNMSNRKLLNIWPKYSNINGLNSKLVCLTHKLLKLDNLKVHIVSSLKVSTQQAN